MGCLENQSKLDKIRLFGLIKKNTDMLQIIKQQILEKIFILNKVSYFKLKTFKNKW